MDPFHDEECTGLAVQTAYGVMAMRYCTAECLLKQWGLIENLGKGEPSLQTFS